VSETCETCRFWKMKTFTTTGKLGVYSHAFGECRIRSMENFPSRDKDDWCGEHEPKQAPKPNIMTRGDRPQPGPGEMCGGMR